MATTVDVFLMLNHSSIMFNSVTREVESLSVQNKLALLVQLDRQHVTDLPLYTPDTLPVLKQHWGDLSAASF